MQGIFRPIGLQVNHIVIIRSVILPPHIIIIITIIAIIITIIVIFIFFTLAFVSVQRNKPEMPPPHLKRSCIRHPPPAYIWPFRRLTPCTQVLH